MLANLMTLLMLVLLQAVLGFDNLLYISLESRDAPPDRQAYVRRVGILVAIVLRIILLFALLELINYVQDPVIGFNWEGIAAGNFNIHSLIVLAGGAFILYTAMKEIWHMIALKAQAPKELVQKERPLGNIIAMIVVMNLVFSFDSILSAMALTHVFWVMATAIVIGGLLMMWLSDKVTDFLRKNRLYEVLGMFILFLVGVMLLTEGAHIAHLEFFGNPVHPLTKTTFYFVIVFLVAVDIVQGRFQRKIANQQDSVL